MNEYFDYLWDFFSESYVTLCIILSVLVPWSVNKINFLLHKHGDPPWKKEESDE